MKLYMVPQIPAAVIWELGQRHEAMLDLNGPCLGKQLCDRALAPPARTEPEAASGRGSLEVLAAKVAWQHPPLLHRKGTGTMSLLANLRVPSGQHFVGRCRVHITDVPCPLTHRLHRARYVFPFCDIMHLSSSIVGAHQAQHGMLTS